MKEKSVILWTVVTIGLIVGALYATRSKILLYEFTEEDSVSGLPIWALLHPLRDRSPERSAERILKTLQEGRIEEALSQFKWSSPARKNDLMSREASYPVQAWKLISRADSLGTAELYYSVTRWDAPGSKELFSSPVWITMVRSESDPSWSALRFRAIY